MIARLEFNLPDEREDFEVAHRAVELYLTLLDMDNYLRELEKYHDDKPIHPSTVRDYIREVMFDRSVSLDMMS